MSTPIPRNRARFGDLVAAEWIKVRSLRSTYGLMAFGLLFAVVAAWWEGAHVRVAPGAAAQFNPLVYPYNDATWEFITVLAATFGVLAVAGEYSSGLIRATFTAVPDRRRVILAKGVVVSTHMALFGVLTSLASLYVAGAALSGQLSGLSLDRPDILRAAAVSAALPVLGALAGMAIGALIRHPAGAVSTAWGVLLFLPTLLASGTIGLGWATQVMPVAAWEAISRSTYGTPHPNPVPAVGVAWLLMAAWPLLSLAATSVVVTRRDV
ncbi:MULTISPECIES: ABC transporter permease [Streptacidiphilus]|uniref:ABC transporter permease n=1 Tax=Streptacidiphilus cavernicola TaxID=3342716 RepID=A0ABV6UW65_9ACTN|nr:ABC transporter permease [Streptacidiphilus jeojiense]